MKDISIQQMLDNRGVPRPPLPLSSSSEGARLARKIGDMTPGRKWHLFAWLDPVICFAENEL